MTIRCAVIGAVALVLSCGPAPAASVISCEDARSAPYEQAQRPRPVDRLGVVQAHEELPVYRFSRVRRSADDIANRAMVLACAITNDQARAYAEIFEWAEDAAATPHNEHRSAGPFDYGDLRAVYGGSGSLKVAIDDPVSSVTPIVPDGAYVDPGVGEAAARQVADAHFQRWLRLGLVTAGGLGQLRFIAAIPAGDVRSGFYVHHYVFAQPYALAGVSLLGALHSAIIDGNGQLIEARLQDIHVADAGSAITEIGLDDARELFKDLARQAHGAIPDRDFGDGSVFYGLVAPEADGTANEPRLLNGYEFAGQGHSAALSLVTPEAGLFKILPLPE